MGETSIWGYVALAAVIVGFAYGIWRQKRREQKKAEQLAAKEHIAEEAKEE